MPGILDRLDPTWIADNLEEERFSGHEIFAVMRLQANGIINGAQSRSRLNLDTDGISDWAWLESRYAAVTDKEKFLQTVHAAIMLLRLGYATQTEVLAAINDESL